MTVPRLLQVRIHLTTLLVVALAACAAPPAKDTDSGISQPSVQQPMRPDEPLRLPASDYADTFAQTEQALASLDWQLADQSLASLPQDIAGDDLAYQRYLLARMYWLRGELDNVEAVLAGLPTATTAPALSARILNFQRYRLALGGEYLPAANVAHRMLESTPRLAEADDLRRFLWRNLERSNESELRSARESTADPAWRGWLELALVTRDRVTAANQAQRLNAWQSQYPGHSAADPLPGGLEQWLAYDAEPTTVALMLPLQGRLAPAAKAVRDGYLASYYQARRAGVVDHEVLVMDTGLYPSTEAAYGAAVAAGAGLVVGPLSKTAVAEVAAVPNRSIPVLALNQPDEVLPTTGGALVQMALAPDDEAQRIAEIAYGRGHRRALVVRPAGDWGNNITGALNKRWRELGGDIAATAAYTGQDTHSGAIKTALKLDASEQRARDVRDMLATNVEFTARRRGDIDVVFLLARSGDDARSLKPLLAYHYAGNLPVFATSSIYSGIPDPRDKDLNGIQLVDVPWLLGSNPAARVAIAAGDTGSDSYTRLNALGSDAFLLQYHYSQLSAGPDALLRGDTGLLSLDPALRIRRETRLATFDGGALKPL